ncbi:ABC transporter permease [Alicyclobacillus mengziensis]|uniref:Transport permease protein n=1 Tax=Alicyclobacillus mengziensis TaxID=2931921 RepID=A0A9X7VZA5_9BACL|nr:ABC transporter permease [Alicyclobacillus mengziensis]QSO47232.1 ABC transporter permease [Alicyclobacillus mengziensis]
MNGATTATLPTQVRSSFFRDVFVLTGRSIIVTLRVPWAIIPNLAISLFFLFVYQGGLSGIAAMPGFDGVHYLNFILPVAVVSGAVGGAGSAGQALIRDLDSRYFTKLRLTPVSRAALVLAPMIAGMLQLVAQTVLILLVAILMGLKTPTGVSGLIVVILLAAGWGLAFAGYAVATALRTGNGQAAQAATFIFFPLLFLSDTFVPLNLIGAKWMKIAAHINPTTYVFDAMRSVLVTGWQAKPLLWGIVAIAILCGLTLSFAVFTAARTLRRA